MEGIRLVNPGRSRNGKGSWTAAVGGNIVNSYSIAEHGEQGAYIKALEDRLNYMTERRKFKLDFEAFEVLTVVKNLLEVLKSQGVEYLSGDKYILHMCSDVLNKAKK